MKKNYKIWAIIPARSGSKGFPNKNIVELNGLPLLAHAIKFAINSELFDRVLLSTDSKEYASIGESHGAWVPFLRSINASGDLSMEEDILFDIDKKLAELRIESPDIVVWLRPTFPFRNYNDLFEGVTQLKQNIDSVRLVVPADPRLYYESNGFLLPFSYSHNKSMIRRQEFPPTFNVFHTEIFWYKNVKLRDQFLGTKIKKVVINKICGFDLDTLEDFHLINAIYSSNHPIVKEYILRNE